MPFAAQQGSIRIGGVDYAISVDPETGLPRRIEFNTQSPFPPVQATASQFGSDQYGLNQRLVITGPIGIGQKQGNDPHRGADQHNVVAWWPGQITRGPQKQTPTQSALPSTFKVPKGSGFYESNLFSRLFLFGVAGSTNDEAIFHLVTTTWTDSTSNADFSGDMKDFVGMVDVGDTLYAIAKASVDTSGGDARFTLKSTSLGVWTEDFSTGSSDETVSVGDSFFGLIAISNRLFSVAYTAATGVAGLARKTVGAQAWLVAGSTFQRDSQSAPRGLLSFRGADGGDDIIWSTSAALIYQDDPNGSSQHEGAVLYRFRNPTGAYTGVMAAGHKGDLYFADGANLGHFRWVDGRGNSEVRYVGPQSRSDIQWSGLVSAKQGDITSISRAKNPPWMIVTVGGLAASKDATVMAFNTETGEWYIPYKGGTSQRAILASINSDLNDGTDRVHFMEEQAAGGDQDPQNFENLFNNPLDDTGWKFTDGVLEDSERDMGFGGLINKIFLTTQLDADDLSSNEKVGFEHAHNGGAFNTEQAITSSSSPARVYTDGSGTAVGTKAKRQQVRWNLDGDEGATEGPTIKSVNYVYAVLAEKPDATVPLEFAIPIMLEESDFKDQKGLSQRMTDINALLTGTLKTLRIGQTDVKVLFRTYQRFGEPKPPGVTANTQPELPGELVLIAYEPGE
jgi:hypothetical protein